MSQRTESIDKMTKALCKLKCLTHFIETQDPKYQKPVDFDDIQYGFSLILEEINIELSELRNHLQVTSVSEKSE